MLTAVLSHRELTLEVYIPMGLRSVRIVPWLKLKTADASPAMFWV